MRKTIIYSLILFVGSIFVLGVIIESSMRLFYEPTRTLDAKKFVNIFRTYTYTPLNDDMGFREAALHDGIFRDDFKRILFLGDSFTFGRGVENGEDRFSDIVESQLNQQKYEFKYHIFNAGVSGTEPKDWVQYLAKLLPVYKPQHVFAVFFLRDGTELCTSLVCYRTIIKRLDAKYKSNFFYKNTYLGKYVGNKLVERKFSDYYQKRLKNSYLGTEAEKKPWIEQQEYLLKIARTCKTRGIDFHLVIFPLLFGLESEYQYYDVEKEISRFAEENNIPVFSLTNGFIGQKSESLWVSPSDQHPNEKAHLIAANYLYPYVKETVMR